jgi:hypothetical protein
VDHRGCGRAQSHSDLLVRRRSRPVPAVQARWRMQRDASVGADRSGSTDTPN